MGGSADPVTFDVPTHGQRAEHLRREKVEKTYDELAPLTGVSAAPL
ncbi:hypothetical protein [Streptomyces sp. NBC_00691]|nr:hypothetical protein [Streptomyces sp. NBC_00691]